MTIESTLAALVEAINAQTAALQRNTDISEELLKQRGGVNQATPETEEKPEPKTGEKKTRPVEETPEPVEETPEPVEDDDKVYTAKDVRDAAMNLRDNVGKDALDKAYKAFKVAKVKELAEENYGPFVRHCEQLANADDEDV